MKPATEIDVAYVIQILFQLHATGADIGFMCSWSVRHGVRFYSVKYSETFMHRASLVLREVIHTYFQQAEKSLPSCNMVSESETLQRHWRSMMEALAKVEVNDLGRPGAPPAHHQTTGL